MYKNDNSHNPPPQTNNLQRQMARLIRSKRKELKITQQELAEKMNVTQPFISKIEKGESFPEEKTLKKIALALNLEEDYFYHLKINLETQTPKTTDQPNFSEINQLQKELQNIKSQLEQINRKHSVNTPIPLYQFTSEPKVLVKEIELPVGAGECFTNDNVIHEYLIPESLTNGATYMIRVKGQSMEPFIMDGEMILVVPQNYIERDGQMAVVNVANQFTAVKFVYIHNGYLGIGKNRDSAQWYPQEEIRIQGIVVNKISSYKVIRDMEEFAKGI